VSRTTRRRTTGALRRFLATEVGGAGVLVVATVTALVWANGPGRGAYRSLWSSRAGVHAAGHAVELTLHGWVNEGAMALFFLVVALEVKRELVRGELRQPRRAAVPVLAALGGMVVPALVFTAIAGGGERGGGWGIPLATDIAFALGALALVGRRAPSSLKVFLLTLAVVDDIGAIVVIAVFYSAGVSGAALAAAAGIAAAGVALRVARVRVAPPYVVVGVALWLALHEAGLHATLAGVFMGLLVPADARPGRRPPVERLERVLHPWTSYAVIPLFALANAGVPLSTSVLGDAVTSRVTLGVAVGLVAGKVVGITGATWLACRLGIGVRPAGASWRDVSGVAMLAAIGFTVSLFIADLAYDAPALVDEARIGILAAGVVAACGGAVLLRRRVPTS
jgi:NhaA family Na+:H+ antiporter